MTCDGRSAPGRATRRIIAEDVRARGGFEGVLGRVTAVHVRLRRPDLNAYTFVPSHGGRAVTTPRERKGGKRIPEKLLAIATRRAGRIPAMDGA